MTELAPVWLETDRIRISGFERRGDGTPIVLLHGVGGNAIWFKPLIDALAGRHVIAIDMPGHGESDSMPDWSVGIISELVFRAARRKGLGKVIWGGHSWGGLVAATIAGTHPECAHSLLLLDPTPASGAPIPAEMFVDLTFSGELGPWNSLAEAKDCVRHIPQYANWSDDLGRAFERGVSRGIDGKWRARVSRETLIAICAAAGQRDHSAIVRKVACPTLFVLADESFAWQEAINLALLPRAARAVIKSNHWLMSSNPAELNRVVGNWLRADVELAATA
jgi:pimeloyl-ACP methyl ester carboxylesterase